MLFINVFGSTANMWAAMSSGNIPISTSVTILDTPIAYLTGLAMVTKTDPVAGEVFTMELQINSQSNGAEGNSLIEGYAIEFTIPHTIEVAAAPKTNSLYTVIPENPQSGDTVKIVFKQSIPVAAVRRVKFDFYFKSGVTLPTATFEPVINLTANNAISQTISVSTVTARINSLPQIMVVETSSSPANFAHSTYITLKPEEYYGGLNQENGELKVIFPVGAEVHYVYYEGVDHPVTTLVSGEKEIIINIGDLKVGDMEKNIELIYSYPNNTGSMPIDYSLDISYTANRINGNGVQEGETLLETTYPIGVGAASDSIYKTATDVILRRADQVITHELGFLPITDMKDVVIIDDPVRGGEIDFFEALEYEKIIWSYTKSPGSAAVDEISTRVFYEKSTDLGNWIEVASGVNGALNISDFGLSVGEMVMRLKFEFSYGGSTEIPVGAGIVRIRTFSKTTADVSDAGTSKSYGDGITNSMYVLGKERIPGDTNYTAIIDDGIVNKQIAETTYTTALPWIGFGGWEQPFSATRVPIGEEFTYIVRSFNVGSAELTDPVAYYVIDKNVEIIDVTFAFDYIVNAEVEIIESDTHQVVKVKYNSPFPITNWDWAFGITAIHARGVSGDSARFGLYYSSGNPEQRWQEGGASHIPGLGTVDIAQFSQWRVINFEAEFALAPKTLSSTDGVTFETTVNALLPTEQTNYYSIEVQNKSDYNLTMVNIIDMLPTIGDTMALNIDEKKSTIAPLVKGIAMKDGSSIPADVTLYYSADATHVSTVAELDDFSNVTATWNVWDGIQALPSSTVAIKIEKSNGLLIDEALDLVLEVEFPATVSGVKVAWNSIATGGKYISEGVDSYILPGEPTKSGIFISESVADKSLAGTFFEDENGNDIQEAQERKLSGIAVKLYDEHDSYLATTTTNATGHYEFENLYESVYRVDFSIPYTYYLSDYKIGSDATVDIDYSDMEGDNLIATAYVNLTTETAPRNIDAGLYKTITIGDFVWDDINLDGVQSPAESGIGNVRLELFRINNNGAEILVDTTISQIDDQFLTTGKYFFVVYQYMILI